VATQVGLALHQEDGGHYWVLWLHDGLRARRPCFGNDDRVKPAPYLTSGYVHTSSRCASISEMQQSASANAVSRLAPARISQPLKHRIKIIIRDIAAPEKRVCHDFS
jgi:hypothetical protein